MSNDDQESIDIQALAEPGLFTVVEFYTDTCPGCRQLGQQYRKFLTLRPDVAVRRVHLSDHWNPYTVSLLYGVDVAATPHVIIYNPQGSVVAADSGTDKRGFELLYQWLNDEYKKDWEQKRAVKL